MSAADSRRELILRSTVECIAQNGYDGVRLRDVSRQAGVSVGMIQHYFDSRDELVAQAIVHLSDGLVQQFFRPEQQLTTPWAGITAMVDQLCGVPNLGAHSNMWVMFGGAVLRHPELKPQIERVYNAWDAHVRAAVTLGIETGEFDPVGEIDDVVATYLAFFDGYEYQMSTGPTLPDPEVLRHRALLLAEALFRPTGVTAESR